MPAAPPPATTNVSINLVPDPTVAAEGVAAILLVTLFFPNEVLFVVPIIPPFADPIGLAI
jgi:hypothetical protein